MTLHEREVWLVEQKRRIAGIIEEVREPKPVDPSIALEVMEKEAFAERPVEILPPMEPEAMSRLGHDVSGLRSHSFEDFVSSPEYIKNAKKIKKLERNWLGEFKQKQPIKTNKQEDIDDVLG